MADETNRNDINSEEYESNAARRLKALGAEETPVEEEPLKINKLANFWHYHRAVILIASAFLLIGGIALAQLLSRQNPDISILYAGPDYITPNDCEAFCDVVESLTEDYNGDKRKYVQVEDLVFMSDNQILDYLAAAQEDNEAAAVDNMKNRETEERFNYEVFGGEAMICILAEDQYHMVADGGGFMKLIDVFGEAPEGAIDEYGVRFAETEFCRFFDAAEIFPDDAVIALRTLPTVSALTGKKRAEKIHGYHEDAFKRIVGFEFPEGYVEKTEE